MVNRVKITASVTVLLALSTTQVFAQNVSDVERYSMQFPSYDAASMVMPGVTNATGFGAYQENPATMALFDETFMSFSLSGRSVNENGTYLGSESEFSDSQLSVGDFGFTYKVPTVRGSLVVGAGYSQSHDYNRALSGGGRNNESTITDFYAIQPRDSDLNEAAFQVWAIDDVGYVENGDTTFVSESIFRFLPEGESYRGIDQDFEFTEKGQLGEYSAFVATEFQENLMVGVSLGVMSGNYTYRRDFLESDRQGNYDDAFIPTDEGDTDIDNILSKDTIDASFSGFSARIGMIYQPVEQLTLGAGYQFKNTISIDERYNTRITTTFDNGVVYEEEAPGEFSYKIRRPDRLNVGFSLKEIGNLTISGAAEMVRYTESRIDFGDIEFVEDENLVNDNIESSLEDVINLRAGIEYQLNSLFTPRLGYAYYQSNQQNFDTSRQFYSGGFSAQVFENIVFDLGVQLATWEDRNELYQYDDGQTITGEVATADVNRWKVVGGFKFQF